MKKLLCALLMLPCIELFSGQNDTVDASVPGIQYCIETDNSSRYIFRGIVLNRNFVVQPGISGNYKNFTAGLWGNIKTESAGYNTGIDEVDMYFSHEFTFSGISVNNNVSVYLYSSGNPFPNTAEYMLKASYFTGPVGYTSELAIDIMEYRGAYILTESINYENAFTEHLYFNTALSLSWAGSKYNSVNSGYERAGFNYAAIDLSFTYYMNSGIYIKPHIQYNRLVDNELQEFTDKETSFFGLLLGYSF